LKGSRWLTLHRVGIEADPAPVCRPGRRPEGSDPRLATRTRGTGGGPRTVRELAPRFRARLQPSPSGGSLRAIACQRPGEAVKGTGPESVRWRLITQRTHVRLGSEVKPRGKQGFRVPSESEDHGRPLPKSPLYELRDWREVQQYKRNFAAKAHETSRDHAGSAFHRPLKHLLKVKHLTSTRTIKALASDCFALLRLCRTACFTMRAVATCNMWFWKTGVALGPVMGSA
jgi:hypothetical protein